MNKRIPYLIGFLLIIIALWLQTTSISYIQKFITGIDNLAYDIQLRTTLFNAKPYVTSTVVIVDLDDKSLDREGRWPWPRSKLATLIQRIQEEGAVVIALDMLFSEPEENIINQITKKLDQINLNTPELLNTLKKLEPYFDNDAKFADSLKQSDTVLGETFLATDIKEGILGAPAFTLNTPLEKKLQLSIASGYLGNISILQNAAKNAGFINVFSDDDGIIRRVHLLIRYQDNLYPSLALEAVRIYLLNQITLNTAPYGNASRLESINLGNHIIPTDEQGQVIVPFRGKSFTFPYYSATDVLNKTIPKDALTGKIVFVGTSATGLSDLKATSIQNIFPGVEVQASIADGILTDNFTYKPSWVIGVELSLTIIIGIIGAFLFPLLGPRSLTIIIVVVPIILILANNWLWQKTGLIVSIFIPICLTVSSAMFNTIYGYLFEARRRERLKDMFGQYVPEKHIDEMLQSTGSYALYGEDRDMTVLFADIRNFTAISESLSASQLKELLNDFFTPMTEIIFKYQGTIDKYVGDLIMAFWGAPLKDKRHAMHAISAALEMQETIKNLESLSTPNGWPEIRIGIGINSGIMSVGDMGSKFRRNYTVLGDAVNLASRIEGLTKHYGVNILVTEHTVEHQSTFVFRKIDRVRVKGKIQGIEIFEPVCKKSEITPEKQKEVDLSNTALNFYFNQEWESARELFSQLSINYPTVKLFHLYLERIARFEKKPPPQDWDGIYSHTKK